MHLTTKTKIKIGFAIAAAVILGVFIFSNMEVIEVNLLFARVEMRRSVMILGVFLIGFLVGWTVRAVFGAIGKAKQRSATESV